MKKINMGFRAAYLLSLFVTISLIFSHNSSCSEGVWERYTSTYYITGIAVNGNDLWYSTHGGAVHRNTETGAYRKYTEDDGLPYNYLRKIAIDDNGVVWAMGSGSLSRFDGASWERIPDGGRFDGSSLLYLDIDNSGKIWVGEYYSISVYDDDHWEDVVIPDIFLKEGMILDFTVDHDNNIWVAIETLGIIKYDGTEWKDYTTINGLSCAGIRTVETAPDGSLWFSIGGSAGYFKDGGWQTFNKSDGLNSSLYSFAFTFDNEVWAAAANLIYHYDGVTWKEFGANEILPYNICVNDSGKLWATRYFRETCSFNGESWSFFPEPPGLCNNKIEYLAKAPDGKLWIGTILGFSVFDGINWEPYKQLVKEYSSYGIENIFFSSDSKTYMNVAGKFFIYNNSEWTLIKGGYPVNSFAEARDGTIWVGTGSGVYSYKDGIFSKFESLIIQEYNVFSDKNGNIWTSANDGVNFYDGIQWIKMGADDPVASNFPGSLLFLKDGSLWVGGFGVSRYDGEKWISYTTQNGFPFYRCSAIAQDSTGVMWFGGDDEGVANFDGTTFHKFTSSDGIPDSAFAGHSKNHINDITVSPTNEIWVTTTDGQYVYDNGSFRKVIVNGKGLSSGPVLFDENGVIWVGTGEGLFKYTPEITNAVENKTGVPELFEIKGNYPNPFNPSTSISFSLSKQSPVEIAVYNIEGQKIKTLFSGVISAGNHSSIWDARNETGQSVSSGIYFARLKSGNVVKNHRMLLLR